MGFLILDLSWLWKLSAKHERCSSSHSNLITNRLAPALLGQVWMQTQHLSEIHREKAWGGLPPAIYKREGWWIYHGLATPEPPPLPADPTEPLRQWHPGLAQPTSQAAMLPICSLEPEQGMAHLPPTHTNRHASPLRNHNEKLRLCQIILQPINIHILTL